MNPPDNPTASELNTLHRSGAAPQIFPAVDADGRPICDAELVYRSFLGRIPITELLELAAHAPELPAPSTWYVMPDGTPFPPYIAVFLDRSFLDCSSPTGPRVVPPAPPSSMSQAELFYRFISPRPGHPVADPFAAFICECVHLELYPVRLDFTTPTFWSCVFVDSSCLTCNPDHGLHFMDLQP